MDFRLTKDQINILWKCLASDPVCSDDFFQWQIQQIHSKDQHAIALEGFKLIYTDKLPTLKPETMSMCGLNLFHQLCHIGFQEGPAGLATNSFFSICFLGKSITPVNGEEAVIFHSFEQLTCLGPLRGFFSCHATLQGPLNLARYVASGTSEIPGHHLVHRAARSKDTVKNPLTET